MVEKCRRYWPDKVGHVMRLPRLNMMIELKESKLFADYTINTLILKQVEMEIFVFLPMKTNFQWELAICV